MSISLYPHQSKAVNELKNGSILCGAVGSGKSRTAISYYHIKECGGSLEVNGIGEFKSMSSPKDLYIITTARKRDTLEWEEECLPFLLSSKSEDNTGGIKVTVDSWNNIKKYSEVSNAFFIFDEQRVVGYGTWVKSFLKIAKKNHWILLSATPGDTWSDYIPVFVAHGYYKNKTEFNREHATWNRYTKYPKIDSYKKCAKLKRQREAILVEMPYTHEINKHYAYISVDYNKENYDWVLKNRQDIFTKEPIKNLTGLLVMLRKIINSDVTRCNRLKQVIDKHPKTIVFYNFNYELDILLAFGEEHSITTAEWNGHRHEPIPTTDSWLYLVQYTAGSEGWNCIQTDTIVFYSQSYSYKAMIQAAGRIDRMNTPFKDLYYYKFLSSAPLDMAIKSNVAKKKIFNESAFAKKNNITFASHT